MTRIKRPGEPASRLPIIGSIKCGLVELGAKHPKSVDYFIASGKYQPSFARVFGEKPSSLPIVFIDDNAEGQCEERYEYRDKSGDLYGYGNGEVFHVWAKDKYETFTTEEHPDLMQKVHEKVGAKGWAVTLTMRFLLPQIPVVGLWQLTTKGEASSIPNITAMFDKMIDHQGSVRGVIFDLNVKFAKSQKPGSKSRYPVIEIIPNNEPERHNQIKTALLDQSKLLKQLKQ